MAFNSFNFWLLFPFIFLFYWFIPSKYNNIRNYFLLIVSYLLYMNWKPTFAIVLFLITIICYIGGVLIEKSSETNKRKKLIYTFFILGVSPLLIFKYYNFFNDSINSLLNFTGLHFAMPGLNWAIPIGISFFTFQAIGYLLDVYHKRIYAEKDFFCFALFVSFFPQITSGPISTAKDLIPQFKTHHIFDYEQSRAGLKMLLWGMFLKLVVGDRMGIYVDTVFPNYMYYNGASCILASIFYTIQIYCDFAGYSLMAIGIAKILGFNLINNFKRPYLAASITEFWKRWHISLTKWLTTHVYINLGGNRCSKNRQYWNIMITFLISGLWHGANWTFIIWGVLHGIFQIIEKMFYGRQIKEDIQLKNNKLSAARFFRIMITFIIINIAWIFFRMPSVTDAINFVGKFFSNIGTPSLSEYGGSSVFMVSIGLIILIIKDLKDEYLIGKCRIFNMLAMRWLSYICIASLILISGVLDGGSFIYVSF